MTRPLGARLRFWFALAFVVGYQLVGTGAQVRWPL